jgi:hypothetical protein
MTQRLPAPGGAWRRPGCIGDGAAQGADERDGLVEALAVLGGGIVPGRDAAAAAEPDPAIVELEGTDRDVQF